uniref:G_PROTEIN_RECEP_F1_2 domain-containing protein n=1 Tax=Ascaris lumbricoides TaxID=6252 RepID=A0A0M3I651_ASCLU
LQILEAEQIIYNCRVVWYPHNEAIYSLARTFISHVNQNNLGVSVWGFAVVTKPLILTTISLTATYLAFVMQMKTSCDCAQLNNVTDVTLFDVILF